MRYGSEFRRVIPKHKLRIKFIGISCEIILKWQSNIASGNGLVSGNKAPH